MSTFKKVSIAVLAVILVAAIAVACIFIFKKDGSTSIFDDSTTTYTLESDYKISGADVDATDGSGKNVTFNKAITLDLNGKTLDLNGYTLKVSSNEENAKVLFKNGTIKNGNLDLSVPKGDIDFDNTTISKDVSYELEAASDTIRFANAKINGSGKVKSDTRILVAFSEVEDISLEGNGKLEAGENATLGKISISPNASGASIQITPKAKVAKMAISAKANIEIAGEVSDVTVNEGAKDAEEIKINVAPEAKIESVELKAAAKVDVAGTVAKVTVAESAKSDNAKVEVKVAATASVTQIDLQAKTDIDIKGAVSSMVVGNTATGTNVVVTGNHAATGRIVINAEDTKVEGSDSAIQSVVISKEVENKVTVPETVKKEVVENIEDYVKAHTYVEEKTEATCTAPGHAKYTCSECGDSYEILLPIKPHNYEMEVVRLPSAVHTGINKYTCTSCGHSYEQNIPATDLAVQSLYELICLYLPDGTYTVTMDEESSVTIYNELSKYDEDNKGYKEVVDISLYKVALTVIDGKPSGSVQLKVDMYEAEYNGTGNIADLDVVTGKQPESSSIIDFYVNDGYVYTSLALDEKTTGFLDLKALDAILNSDAIKRVFGYNVNITVEDVVLAIELMNKTKVALENYKPFIEAINNASANHQSIITAQMIIDFFDEYIVKEEELEENAILYYVEVAGLAQITDKLATETVKTLIDGKFGEESFDSVVAFVKNLPNLTVKEIADVAIALAENYEFDVDYTFEFVESLIFELTEQEIDLKALLEGQYDKTIGDIIYANLPEDMTAQATKEQFVAGIVSEIDGYASMLETLTIDQMFNALAYGDINYKPVISEDPETGEKIYSETVFALSEQINMLLTMVDEMAEFSVLCNGEGVVEEIYVNTPYFQAIYSVTEGTYTIQAIVMNYQATITYDPETTNGTAKVEAYDEESESFIEMYYGEFTYGGEENDLSALVKMADQIAVQLIANVEKDELNTIFNGTLFAMGYELKVDANKEEGTANVILAQGQTEMGKIELVTEDDDTVATTIYFAGAPIATFDVYGNTIYDLKVNSSINLPGNPENEVSAKTANVELTTEKLEEGKYKFSLKIAVIDLEDETTEETDVTFIITFSEEENQQTISIDTLIMADVPLLNTEEQVVIMDGVVTLTTTYNEDNDIEKIYSLIDIDRMFGSVSRHGGIYGDGLEFDTVTEFSYTEMNYGITIDFTTDGVAKEEEFDYIDESLARLKEFEVEYSNFNSNDYTLELLKLEYDVDKDGAGFFKATSTFTNHPSEKTTHTAIIPAKDGLPTLGLLTIDELCDEWVEFRYSATLPTDCKVEYVGTDLSESYESNYSFVFEGCYNVETKEYSKTDDVHTYTYQSVKKNGKNCSDGLEVTATCSNCGLVNEFETYSHDYNDGCYYIDKEVQTITTPNDLCGIITITTQECISCGYGDVTVSDNRLNNGYIVEEETGEITKQQLEELDIDVDLTGFTGADKHTRFCHLCGIKRIDYTFGIYNSTTNVCDTYVYSVFDYPGQKETPDSEEYAYQPATACTLVKTYGCYSTESIKFETYDEEIVAAKNVVKAFVGNELFANLDDTSSAYYKTSTCKHCNKLYDLEVQLYTDDGWFRLDKHYDMFGEYYGASVESYAKSFNFAFMRSYLDKFGLEEFTADDCSSNQLDVYYDLEGMYHCSSYYYSVNGTDAYDVYVNIGEKVFGEVYFYDHSACQYTRTYYDKDGNVLGTTQGERHDSTYVDGNSTCCVEDGWTRTYFCEVCGEEDYSYEEYYHTGGCPYFDDMLLKDCTYVTTSTITTEDIRVQGSYCVNCEKAQNVAIVLYENWTLTDNVYIYAEGLTLDLNGFDIDLNGFNLIIYGINGSEYIIITDNKAAENGLQSEIKDSQESGHLVVFTADDYAYVDATFIEFNCEYFMSDTDSRDTIEETFSNLYHTTLNGFTKDFN